MQMNERLRMWFKRFGLVCVGVMAIAAASTDFSTVAAVVRQDSQPQPEPEKKTEEQPAEQSEADSDSNQSTGRDVDRRLRRDRAARFRNSIPDRPVTPDTPRESIKQEPTKEDVPAESAESTEATAEEVPQEEEPKPKEIADPTLPHEWASEFEWRSIGPANMSGRITALAVYEKDSNIWWAATASGGLLKTTNNGTTFEHQFDDQKTVSIGDVAVAQSDPNIVWVGTGESNPRNSVSWGDGVYKSTDGGETWKNMGLRKSFQIGAIAIHAENPDIVYVGALGRLWGPNEERGLYKTTDGGETWNKMLYVDDKTGVMDIDMHPTDFDTLLVATYERERDGFDTNDPAKKWGPGSGIYKTVDGGNTWQKISAGIPSTNLGRIGIDYYRADPDIVYAVIESEKIGEEPENAAYLGIRSENAEVGARLTEVMEETPAAEAGLQTGDIVIAVEDRTIHSSNDLTSAIRRQLAGDTVLMEVSRDRESVEIEVTFAMRPGAEEDAEESDGSSNRRARNNNGNRNSPFRTRLGGQIPNVQDQQGPEGAEKGGVYRSEDGGETWTRINSLNPRPMYFSEIRVDPSDNNYVYVLGIPLYRSSDGGETFSNDGGRGGVHVDHHAMWIDPEDGRRVILGNDGGVYVTHDRMEHWDHLNHVAIGQFYHVGVGPRENYMVYGGLQDNGSWGGPSRVRNNGGPMNSDWFRVGGGDGFICLVDPEDPDQIYAESQNGGLIRYNLRTGERGWMQPRAPRGMRYRFNWRTPFILSHHNSKMYYTAGNYVFRSYFKGNNLEPISPELTNTDRGSATALAESPRDSDVLYVGTDDGAVWVTQDGGASWLRAFGHDMVITEEEEADEDDTDKADDEKQEASEESLPDESEETSESETESDVSEPAELSEDAPVDEDRADPITGTWIAEVSGGPGGGGGGRQMTFELHLKLSDKNRITGEVTSRMGDSDITDGSFDPETNAVKLTVVRDEFESEFTGSFDPETGKLKGEMVMAGGRFTLDIEAEKQSPEAGDDEQQGEGERGSDRGGRRGDRENAGALPEFERIIHKIEDLELEGDTLADLLPGPRWVSSLEASRVAAGRVYATFDGHRSDDDLPYVFVSEDFGQTWKSLTTNLPDDVGSARVIREDIVNPNILYLGTEFSMWVSVDRGETWTSMNSNLPTVAIHEVAQHATVGEIVVGTHGRSLWVLDVTALRQLTPQHIEQQTHLYRPNTARLWATKPSSDESMRSFEGDNPDWGAHIFYSMRNTQGRARITVYDFMGNSIRELDDLDTSDGLHQITWDLRQDPVGRQWRGPRVAPGKYVVALTIGRETFRQPLMVETDPEYPEIQNWGVEYDVMLEQMNQMEEEEEGAAEPEADDI